MRYALLALIVLLAVAVPTEAQVVYDTAPAGVWLTAASCPASWAAMTPPQTRPALPDTYRVVRPGGGAPMIWSLAAVRSAWTVDGVLRQAALDAALASGAVVSLRPGRAAQVRCTWRPVGGSP